MYKENIYKLLVDEQKKIVFAVTDEGILIYKKQAKQFILNNKITYKSGLIRGKINALYFENSNLYVSTRNGISKINNPLIKKKVQNGKIDIEKVICNDRVIKLTNFKTLQFKSNENNIDIITSIFSFAEKENQNKYYSISKDNEKDVWKTFRNSTLSFKELASGNYRISFYVNFKKDIQILLKYIFSKFNLDFQLKFFDHLEYFYQSHHLHFGQLIDTDMVCWVFLILHQLEGLLLKPETHQIIICMGNFFCFPFRKHFPLLQNPDPISCIGFKNPILQSKNPDQVHYRRHCFFDVEK